MSPDCSAMRVRRLQAGEFAGAEREQIAQHVASCARCLQTQRELEAERELLQREAPFPQFAAGVAEKLAQRRPRRAWMAPLALAAGVLLAVSSAIVLRPADTETTRVKGGPGVQLFVQDASGVHRMAGPVAEGARLRVSLHPAGQKHAKVTLVEPGETSVIYDGPAVDGPLPQAFEWTGRGDATLRVQFDTEVVELPLHR